MKIKINQKILERDLAYFLKDSLISQYNKVKDNPNPNKKDIKYLGYHAIAYFQYLNLLRINQAVELYKEHILSNGQKDKLIDIVYYNDGIEKKIKKNELVIPLYFDGLLKDVSKYLMNYKGIVDSILIDSYTKYFRKKYHINPSNITLYAIINLLENIGLYSLKALKEHWTIINKEILPYLLEKTQVVETKKDTNLPTNG